MENNNENRSENSYNQTHTGTDQSQTNLHNEPEGTASDSPNEKFVLNYTTLMASLSYVGPLVLIPLLTNRDKPFVLFHIKQGLVLFIISVVGSFLTGATPIVYIIHLIIIVLSIIGIINSLQKKEEEVPFVGRLATHIKL